LFLRLRQVVTELHFSKLRINKINKIQTQKWVKSAFCNSLSMLLFNPFEFTSHETGQQFVFHPESKTFICPALNTLNLRKYNKKETKSSIYARKAFVINSTSRHQRLWVYQRLWEYIAINLISQLI